MSICLQPDFLDLLTVDPEERLNIDEVVEHPWLQKGRTPDTPLVTPNILDMGAGEWNACYKWMH